METNALAAQALLTLRALIRNSHPERMLSDMQRGEKLALLLLEEAGRLYAAGGAHASHGHQHGRARRRF